MALTPVHGNEETLKINEVGILKMQVCPNCAETQLVMKCLVMEYNIKCLIMKCKVCGREFKVEKPKFSAKKYEDRYRKFITHSKRIWINVLLHRAVGKLLEKQGEIDKDYLGQIVEESKSPVGLQDYERKRKDKKFTSEPAPIKLKGRDLRSFVDSSTGAGSEWMLEWSLVTAVSLFEGFVSDIAKMAYLEYPEDFLINSEKIATDQENSKLLAILIKSETREETLEKYVEEKLRGIFYGKPIDLFIPGGEKAKDGKLRLNTTGMGETCKTELHEYAEILGRRNLITHNMGRVDAKYLRETEKLNTQNKLSLGDKVKITEDYLFRTLEVVDKLAFEYKTMVLARLNGIHKEKQGTP
jgi:transcription elongation factor Elf1